MIIIIINNSSPHLHVLKIRSMYNMLPIVCMLSYDFILHQTSVLTMQPTWQHQSLTE